MDLCLIVWATMAKKQKSIHASTLEFERRQNETKFQRWGDNQANVDPLLLLLLLGKK